MHASRPPGRCGRIVFYRSLSPAEYAEAWYSHGSALSDLNRYDEAIISYDVATALRPKYAEAWYNRGVALGALGRYAEAVASYDCVIAINPDDADAWYSRGHALRCLDRQEEADASHDKAVALDPGCGAMNGPGHLRKKIQGNPVCHTLPGTWTSDGAGFCMASGQTGTYH